MGPKRGRTTHGASTSKSRRHKGNPPPLQNPHDIEFIDTQQQSRYNTLVKRGILSTRYLDENCLRELGLWDDVSYLLGRVGWINFVEAKHPTYERVTLEFLSSLDAVLFNGEGVKEGKITFRLFNQSHTLTLAQLNEIFGFPEGGARIVPKNFNLTPFWTSIALSTTQRPYDPSLSRASAIYNPCFRYLQRFMAFTIFGRGESDGVMCQRELYLLCAMVEGHRVDTGAFMIHHMCRAARATSGKIVFGGLITTLAYGLGLGEFVEGLHPLNPSASINLDACLHMKLIGRKGNRLWLCFQDDYLFLIWGGEDRLARSALSLAALFLLITVVQSASRRGEIPMGTGRISLRLSGGAVALKRSAKEAKASGEEDLRYEGFVNRETKGLGG